MINSKAHVNSRFIQWYVDYQAILNKICVYLVRVRACSSMDKPMSCKPGIASSIPGFSIKPLLVSLRVLQSYKKNTHIINPPGPVLVTLPMEKPQKVFFSMVIKDGDSHYSIQIHPRLFQMPIVIIVSGSIKSYSRCL